MARTFAILTATYRGDLAVFADLCASIDRHMPGVRHYVLVDQSDWALFQPFAGPDRILLAGHEQLPQFHEFTLFGRRLWWRWPARIVRGWIYQQVAKIRVASQLDENAVVLTDSDAIFIRPLAEADLFDGDRVRLFHSPGRSSGPPDQSPLWHDAASRSLGLEPSGYTGADYISTAVIWSPEVVRRLVARVERATSRRWFDALVRHFRFSEYVLYGVFAQHVEGEHRDLVSPTVTELCHCSWHYDLDLEADVARFVANLAPRHAAILIQSNLGLGPDRRAAILQRFGLGEDASGPAEFEGA